MPIHARPGLLARAPLSAALLLAASAIAPAHADAPRGAQVAAPFQSGPASFYRHGARTANGERFDPAGLTAAHRTLPFGSRVRVTCDLTGRSVVVRINDRGPFTGGRVIDLSLGAAQALGMVRRGVSHVTLHRLD